MEPTAKEFAVIASLRLLWWDMIQSFIQERFRTGLNDSENSVAAFMAAIDCDAKSVTEISNESLLYLREDFEQYFFYSKTGRSRYVKNISRVISALFSLGGSYQLALQQKHFDDLYDYLYQPRLNEMRAVNDKSNGLLKHIGDSFVELNTLLKRAENILKTNRSVSQESRHVSPELTLKQIEKFKSGYKFALKIGFGGLVGGTSAIGAWGVVSVIGSASTGTAIASLSGAAATNATLAWFGGGSLAAGGAGMAGGVSVLGAIVAVPAVYFATKSSYSKVETIEAKKVELIKEIEQLDSHIKEAQSQIEELYRRRKFISDLLSAFSPLIVEELYSFKRKSPLTYKLFGGKMNAQQLRAYNNLNKIVSELLYALSGKHNSQSYAFGDG